MSRQFGMVEQIFPLTMDWCPAVETDRVFFTCHSSCSFVRETLKVRISERPLLGSHSRWRRVSRDPPSPAGNRFGMARREERTYSDDNDACWSPLGAGSEFTGALCSLLKSSCGRFSELKRHRTRARRVRLQGCLGSRHLQQRRTLHLGAGLTKETLWSW